MKIRTQRQISRAAKKKKYGKVKKNKRKPQDTKKQVVDITSRPSNGCFSPQHCKSKHVPMTQDKTLLENAEKLFKYQQIKVVNTEEECREVVRELVSHCEEYNVLGFSRCSRDPVALLQLASHRGLCALIRLCNLKKIPIELQQLLEDENILKVGVNPQTNVFHLVNDYGINRVASTFDLRILAEQYGLRGFSLAKLCEVHLKVQINQNKCISMSNWEYQTLKDIQIEYAAKEVYVSVVLFKIFADKLKPKSIDVDQKEYMKEFINDHCGQNFTFRAYLETKPVPKPENHTIHIIKTIEGCQAVAEILKSHCDEYNVLGMKFFTMDVRSGPKIKRIDLLQLATHRGLCAIIFLNELEYIPTELQQILNDAAILKVGLGFFNKKKNKKNNIHCDIRFAGSLDLNYLLSHYFHKPLHLNLSQLSKWFLKRVHDDRPPKKLQDIEKNYTKNEALLSIEIFQQFVEKLEFERVENSPKENLRTFIERYCFQYLDKVFSVRNVQF